MKVIDLLNKIANGEEVPNKVKYNGIIFTYKKEFKEGVRYVDENELSDDYFQKLICHINKLNDEVEIIEEEKKIPEKLNYKEEYMSSSNGFLLQYCVDFAKKIDEIIDYLKSKGKQ